MSIFRLRKNLRRPEKHVADVYKVPYVSSVEHVIALLVVAKLL